MRKPCVYILASRPRGTLYVGMTQNLARRMVEHREGLTGGFTDAYNVRTLVYCEFHATVRDAFEREQRLKRWRRRWKLELIESANPEWRDLFVDLV